MAKIFEVLTDSNRVCRENWRTEWVFVGGDDILWVHLHDGTEEPYQMSWDELKADDWEAFEYDYEALKGCLVWCWDGTGDSPRLATFVSYEATDEFPYLVSLNREEEVIHQYQYRYIRPVKPDEVKFYRSRL